MHRMHGRPMSNLGRAHPWDRQTERHPMKTRVIAAAGTLGLAAALLPMVSASAADLLICHQNTLQTVSGNANGHLQHTGDYIEGRDGDAAWIRAHCGGGTTPTTTTTTTATSTTTATATATDTATSTVTETVTVTVPGPGVTTTLPGQTITLPAETITLPGETVTLPAKTVTLPGETVTLPGNTVTLPAKTVPGPVSTVTVKAAASTVTKTAAAAGVAATEDGPSKRLAYTGSSAWEPVGLGAGLLLAGILLLLGRRTLATERRH
jgi:hypothetical protein